MNLALKSFAENINPNNDKIIILLIDQAGFHRGHKLIIPAGIILFPLPPYTPELQPTERIWPLLREAVANEAWHSLDALQDVLITRWKWIFKNTKYVQRIIGFDWICSILKQS